MQAYLRRRHPAVLWRGTYIACTVLVSSYILFEVLDLDGSDFPSQRYPAKGAFLSANDLKDIERVYLPKPLNVWGDASNHFTGNPRELGSFYKTTEPRKSRLDSTRDHGYRVALPRSSIPDAFPSA